MRPNIDMTPDVNEILNAVRDNPEVRDTLRRELLSQDLLELPERFAAHAAATERRLEALETNLAEFIAATNRRLEALEQGQEELRRDVGELKQGQEELRRDVGELKQGQEELRRDVGELKQGQEELRRDVGELRQGQEELRQGHNNLFTIVTRIRDDTRTLKAAHARTAAERDILGITLTGNCLPVRQVTELELYQMLRDNQPDDIDRATQESFRKADLVIEAEHEDTGEIHYFAVEASYTAGLNDIRRAVRNAEYLARFTGRQAQAVVASVDATPDAAAAFQGQGCTHYAIARRHLETD